MKKIFLLSFIVLFYSSAFGQLFKEQLTFSATGDQVISLGRYNVGTAIKINVHIAGGWAEDGGIYHIVSHWGGIPVVSYRNESHISTRLKFHAYQHSNNSVYLFATWDNQSPSGGHANTLKFTIESNASFDKNLHGDFANASELPNVLSVESSLQNVGIGVTTPSEKLDVNGTIRSKEIKVEASPWPDYVFEENYDLKDLSAVEEFIKENGHLPNIPSAKQVEKEGIKLGQMNAQLLEKIEELTLYIIQQEKENKSQEAQLHQQKLLILQLLKRIEDLEGK